MTWGRGEHAAVGAVLCLVLGLQLWALEEQSLIGDAPYILLAGHQALRYGQNTLNLSHPPLAKLLVAMPLMGEKALAPPLEVEEAFPAAFRIFDDPGRLHRVRRRSRAILLFVIVLPFFASLGWLGYELWGPRAGVGIVAFTGLSFSVLPYLTTMQTDGACALGFALTLAAGVSLQRRPRPRLRRSLGVAALLGLGLGIALASKFSGLFLLPPFLLALALAQGTRRQRLGMGLVAVACAWVAPATAYWVANRRESSVVSGRTLTAYAEGRGGVGGRRAFASWLPVLEIVSEHSPSLAQSAAGVLAVRAQSELGAYPSYAFGDLSSDGRFWYFPAVLAVKLPLSVLAGLLLAAADRSEPPIAKSKRPPPRALALCALAASVYLIAAMTSSYNLGMRHLLPVVPLLLLPAVCWAARRPRAFWTIVTLLGVEAALVGPTWMSSTNTWWLRGRNPTRLALSHSNFEAHQNFITLAKVMERRHLEPAFVLYPGLRKDELRAYSARLQLLAPGSGALRAGWYAVNGSVPQLMPKLLPRAPPGLRDGARFTREAERWQPLWAKIQATCAPKGWVAGTFELYECG